MKPRVKTKISAIRKILRSAPVQEFVDEKARRGAAAAGDGFEAVSRPHRYTSRAYVQTADATGRRREAEDKVLIQALDAMR